MTPLDDPILDDPILDDPILNDPILNDPIPDDPILDDPILDDTVRRILDGPHLSVLATTDADGKAQTSVIFVKREDDHILFSTIKGRRKTTNIGRDPRVNLLVHALPALDPPYATIAGTVELTDDPDGSFHQQMYSIHMGGASPPPEPGAERVIARILARQVYLPPAYDPGLEAATTVDEQRAQDHETPRA